MDLGVSDILGPGGLVAEKLDGYEPRPEQLEMACAVEQAFADAEHLVVEAGTGVGKSFAYLAPAILATAGTKRRVVISTYTIALQEQLISKDIPFLRKILPMKFTAVLGKGRSNYICLRRLETALKDAPKLFKSADQLNQLHELAQWASGTNTGAQQDIEFQVDPALWQKVRSEHGSCRSGKCDHFSNCPFQASRRRMQSADVLVVNHALFFSDLALRRESVELLGSYDLVILDEAHTAERVAGDHFGQSVSSAALEYLLRDLYNDSNDRGLLALMDARDAIAAVHRASIAGESFFRTLASYKGPGMASNGRITAENIIPNELTPALNTLVGKLESLATGPAGKTDQSSELQGYAGRAREMAGQVESLLSQTHSDHVHWITARQWRRRQLVTLASAPIDVSKTVRTLLFDEVKSVVLTSATLATARGGRHGFDYIRGRLGLAEGRELLLASPFDYRRQAKLYVETQLGQPNNLAEFLPHACRAMEYYIDKSQGRCFVLFTSYAMLKQAEERLEGFCQAGGYELLAQGGKLQLGAMLKKFRRSQRSVLLGTMSFWQGVDVAGEALSNVIITKLPFAVPNEPTTEARVEAIQQAGGNAFSDYQMPEAIIRFKQGFGRLIRSSNDTGFVVVLDHRIATKHYGRAFINSLPDIEVVRDEFSVQDRAHEA